MHGLLVLSTADVSDRARLIVAPVICDSTGVTIETEWLTVTMTRSADGQDTATFAKLIGKLDEASTARVRAPEGSLGFIAAYVTPSWAASWTLMETKYA